VRFPALKQFIISWYGESVVFSFSSLQSLLSKISYEIFCRKHCKEGAIVITHFWAIPQIYFFSSKNLKIFQQKTKKNLKNNNSEKRMSERPENGYKLVEEAQKFKD
jgi:hypothetical protein